MRIEVKGRNLPVSEDLREHVTKRFRKVSRQVSELAELEVEVFEERNPAIPDSQVADLREQIAGMLSGLFGGRDALAHAFVGAGESLAGWWLSHPERTKDEVATLLLDIASLGLGEATASVEPLEI